MQSSSGKALMSVFLSILTIVVLCQASASQDALPTVCIIGSGIGGSSVAHFLRRYSPNSTSAFNIRIFERNKVVGGRMATINIAGQTFEAGASILHPKNYHALNYTKFLNLKIKKPSSESLSLGIWNGKRFVFKTLNTNIKIPFIRKLVALANSVRLFVHYGTSLLRMESIIENSVNRFLKYYQDHESRPVFETVDEMLKWSELQNLTTRTLHDELIDAGLSPLLIEELVTVITRINYGQSNKISGLAGLVSLAGSGGGLWSIEGGNWQMAAGLLNESNITLHIHEEINSVAKLEQYYELNSTQGKSYKCAVAVVASPLDELDLQIVPPISIPKRKLQHTHATFVRGILNPAYFGFSHVSKLPDLVGTLEDPELPFSSISVLKQLGENDAVYKIFSRKRMADSLLDNLFSVRKETRRITWSAYPRYHAPELFAPFVLDGQQMYYVNAFENAASTMETSAIAAENIARLILSTHFGEVPLTLSNTRTGADEVLRVEL